MSLLSTREEGLCLQTRAFLHRGGTIIIRQRKSKLSSSTWLTERCTSWTPPLTSTILLATTPLLLVGRNTLGMAMNGRTTDHLLRIRQHRRAALQKPFRERPASITMQVQRTGSITRGSMTAKTVLKVSSLVRNGREILAIALRLVA